MKKLLGALFVGLFVFSVLSLFSIGMSHYYFQTGVASYHNSQDPDNWSDYNKNIIKAISCFEYALAFNRLGIFDKYYGYDIYYYLTLSYWHSNNTAKAGEYIDRLLDGDNVILDKERKNELEFLRIRSGIVVNGVFEDGTSAIVNQNLVKVNDSVNGVSIYKITPEYLVFKYNGMSFTDSVDRVNPLVMQGISEVRRELDQKINQSTDYFEKEKDLEQVLTRSQTLISDYALDKPDFVYLNKAIVEIKLRLAHVQKEIARINKQKTVFAGMSDSDVIKIIGHADQINTIYGDIEQQKWIYDDATLVFENTDKGLILKEYLKNYSEN